MVYMYIWTNATRSRTFIVVESVQWARNIFLTVNMHYKQLRVQWCRGHQPNKVIFISTWICWRVRCVAVLAFKEISFFNPSSAGIDYRLRHGVCYYGLKFSCCQKIEAVFETSDTQCCFNVAYCFRRWPEITLLNPRLGRIFNAIFSYKWVMNEHYLITYTCTCIYIIELKIRRQERSNRLLFFFSVSS